MTASNLLSVESHFAFGKNWLDYAQKIDEHKIAQAISNLQRLSGRERFDGLSFLDIGCGSGLHSLAALRLGASRVVGVDIDPNSVAASRGTLQKFADDAAPAKFNVCSVFDMSSQTHGQFDIVYSWGVLHHTGDMYRALTIAAGLVKPGGVFLVALYTKTSFCATWTRIKRWYTSASPKAQRYARVVYIRLHALALKLKGQNFNAYVNKYLNQRGMDYYNDIHDWMGGYPYESIAPQECRTFFAGLDLQLEREFILAPGRRPRGLLGAGCDEYTFRRSKT